MCLFLSVQASVNSNRKYFFNGRACASFERLAVDGVRGPCVFQKWAVASTQVQPFTTKWSKSIKMSPSEAPQVLFFPRTDPELRQSASGYIVIRIRIALIGDNKGCLWFPHLAAGVVVATELFWSEQQRMGSLRLCCANYHLLLTFNGCLFFF